MVWYLLTAHTHTTSWHRRSMIIWYESREGEYGGWSAVGTNVLHACMQPCRLKSEIGNRKAIQNKMDCSEFRTSENRSEMKFTHVRPPDRRMLSSRQTQKICIVPRGWKGKSNRVESKQQLQHRNRRLIDDDTRFWNPAAAALHCSSPPIVPLPPLAAQCH